jgi:hypothetical protein
VSVFIGIPSYDGKLHWTTTQGLVGVAHICAKSNIGIAVDIIPHDAFIGKARNMIVKRFMDSGMSDLVFVDADIGFDPQGVVDLCKAAPDIVMGLYMMKSPQPRYPALMADPVVRHPSDMRLIKLQYGPSGFMRIRRSVIEKMIARWPEEYYIDGAAGKVYDLFPHGRYDYHFTGEDIKFCERAINCGLDIWAMQGIRLRHFGERSWDSDWRIDVASIAPAEMGAPDGYVAQESKLERKVA